MTKNENKNRRETLEAMDKIHGTSNFIERTLYELSEDGWSTTEMWNETLVRPFGWSESIDDMMSISQSDIEPIDRPYGLHQNQKLVSVSEFEDILKAFLDYENNN